MKKQPKSGIYLITCIRNGKRYVGKDSDLPKRWRDHKRDLLSGKHWNLHLQRAWDLYGEDAFIYCILEYCEKDKLVEKEDYWMTYFDCLNNNERGYNIRKADNSIVSDETKAKLSAAHTGKTLSPEHRAKLSSAKIGKPPWNKGIKLSP